MGGISLAVMLAFSFFRPREKKVYAPKVKYREENEDAAPPPVVSSRRRGEEPSRGQMGSWDEEETESSLSASSLSSPDLERLLRLAPASGVLARHDPGGHDRSGRRRVPPVPQFAPVDVPVRHPHLMRDSHPSQRSVCLVSSAPLARITFVALMVAIVSSFSHLHAQERRPARRSEYAHHLWPTKVKDPLRPHGHVLHHLSVSSPSSDEHVGRPQLTHSSRFYCNQPES